MVVTNHGRSMDFGEGVIKEIYVIAERLKSKKGTQNIEMLFDSDIREATDIKALALGAHGSLISQLDFWAISIERKRVQKTLVGLRRRNYAEQACQESGT